MTSISDGFIGENCLNEKKGRVRSSSDGFIIYGSVGGAVRLESGMLHYLETCNFLCLILLLVLNINLAMLT